MDFAKKDKKVLNTRKFKLQKIPQNMIYYTFGNVLKLCSVLFFVYTSRYVLVFYKFFYILLIFYIIFFVPWKHGVVYFFTEIFQNYFKDNYISMNSITKLCNNFG